MQKIILASGSPRRKELLGLVGISYEVHKSDASEEVTSEDPEEIVKELSARKARDVAEKIRSGCLAVSPEYRSGTVLGADTIVWKDGRLLGKPADRREAGDMLRFLQGEEHQVYTGVTLIDLRAGQEGQVKEDSFAVRTNVFVHAMSEEEIEAYLDTGDAFDKAGSYGIQGPFAAFVDRIEGDYQNVVGLPVCAVYHRLMQMDAAADQACR